MGKGKLIAIRHEAYIKPGEKSLSEISWDTLGKSYQETTDKESRKVKRLFQRQNIK